MHNGRFALLSESPVIFGYNTHRPADRQAMLQAIGLSSMEALFNAIPAALKLNALLDLPPPLPEWELERHMQGLANKNLTTKTHRSFLGGGVYEHYIPAVVDAIAGRGEFLTSYTPYQPEISQGLLQALFEYQSALAVLTGLPVVNGSCYDGATALADAAWTCCLISGQGTKAELLLSETLWPQYRQVVDTYMQGRGVVRHSVPFDPQTGQLDLAALEQMLTTLKPAGFLFQTPNALGVFEDVRAIASLCKRHDVVSACSFNPFTSGITYAPGELGVDIVTCDGQPLGLPLHAGGPTLGVFATRDIYRKYVPGRLVGKVTDINGNPAYALVYEDREQHVARERATSNICSNQAHNALRAVIFLASVGNTGLAKFAALNVRKAHYLLDLLRQVEGLRIPFSGAFFNEFVVALPTDAPTVLGRLRSRGIFGGIDYSGKFGLKHALLVAVTETKTRDDLDMFAFHLREATR